MPEFYGVQYKHASIHLDDFCDAMEFDDNIVTDEDFHNMIYTAMKPFIEYSNTKIAFRSQNDYTHLGLTRNNDRYEIDNIKTIIPLIDKTAIRAMIDSEMMRLSEYADLAGLNSTKSARNI